MSIVTRRNTWQVLVIVGLLALGALPALALAGPGLGAPTQAGPDMVEVSDQPVQGGSVTVKRVVAAQAGWMVIHADNGGNPGPVLGQTAVNQGENTNVKVMVGNGVQASSKLHAMLHIDAGTKGTYEFPGPDAPVQRADGTIVNVPFMVSAAQASAAPSPAASAQAPTSDPGTLPNAGADAGLGLPLLLAIAVACVLSGVMLRMRQVRIK